jgi:hypothetical protein
LTQQVVVKEETAELFAPKEQKQIMRKKQVSIQELVDSLKSTADDVGQISELNSEERVLVTQFFASLLKLMQPLATSIPVSPSALPAQLSDVTQAFVDPTGHLALQFEDGNTELKDLAEERNRDLMTNVIGDILPKFKALTSMQKQKLENRIKMLSSVTKELQKSSEVVSSSFSSSQ